MVRLNRIAAAAVVSAVALLGASVPLKSASADNDNWGRHSWGNGGSFYFNTGPGYYYNPAPTYYYPPPTYYYAPPPAYYYPAPSYGPSFGFSVRVR